MPNDRTLTMRRACASALVWVYVEGCADDSTTTSRASARPNAQISAGRGAGALGTDSPQTALVQPSAAGSNAAATTQSGAGCAPGMFSGSYDIGLLGTGPISFDLIANDPATSSAVPCQEFCPELVVSSEGGGFSADWFGVFSGVAKLKGGLDCHTGEFRAELVAGRYGIDPNSTDPNTQALGGDLMAKFVGHFDAGKITGDLMCSAPLEFDGNFEVTREP
jgi:hypothetical protein